MRLLGGGRHRMVEDAIEGTAKVVDLAQFHRTGKPRDGDSWWWEDASEALGKSKYTLELEVTLSGREPYRVKGTFKVPAKAERTGLTRTSLSRGLQLPVRVDPSDPERVEIDWDRFALDPGRKQALGDARVSRQNEVLKAQIERKPKMQAKMWAQNKQAAAAWVEAVKAGNMSSEELETSLRQEVDSGRMDPADAEAARIALGS
jgi:hypothetical protein